MRASARALVEMLESHHHFSKKEEEQRMNLQTNEEFTMWETQEFRYAPPSPLGYLELGPSPRWHVHPEGK
eukprot:3739399-Pleurochrysis_carterae.AAC.1